MLIHIASVIALFTSSVSFGASHSDNSDNSDRLFENQSNGVSIGDHTFPWELVLDRGKILGCVYDNNFFSLGSILILESLPRKCELASDRNGQWQPLTDAELVVFKDNQAAIKEAKEQTESQNISSDSLTVEEKGLIRYLRIMKVRQNNKRSK